MSLADDFRSVLTGVHDLVGDPATQSAIIGDLGLIEQLVESGAGVEEHIASWFRHAYNATPGITQSPVAAAAGGSAGATPATPVAPADEVAAEAPGPSVTG